jgi:Ca2+-binding RTX toxin-like protein
MVSRRLTCCVELMEPRRLMSASPEQGLLDAERPEHPLGDPMRIAVSLDQGVLTITGTDGNDDIIVGIASRRLDRVTWRGRWQFLQRARPRHYEVAVNVNGFNVFTLLAGDVGRIPVGKVRSIVVNAGAGDDSVVIGGDYKTNVPVLRYPRSQPATADAVVHGGEGADFIVGGGGNDRLYGEAGDDRMFGLGGFGNTVDGGEGNDVLGDACEDRGLSLMLGGPGDDILVGHPESYLTVPPGTYGSQGVPHSLFGGPGNDQFRAGISEVRDLEPGESVSEPVCHRVR